MYDDPKRTIDIVMDWISWIANHHLTHYAIVGLGGVTFGLWVDALLRRREETVANSQDQVAIDEGAANEKGSLTEAEQREVYEGAHEELMLFVAERVFPTCEAIYKLQDALLRRIVGSSTVADMAMSGARASYWVQPYAEGMDYLHGLVSSPSEYLYFREMIEAVERVEKGYRAYVGVAAKLSEEAGIILKDDPDLKRLYHQWRANHQSMYDAYDRIKIDSRFKIDANSTGLFRPARKSRWGELVGASSLSVSSQFLKPEDTPA